MMTIKEFAQLCHCNTQTLRYYDRINLLKPIKVDPWSNYRYYEEFQAISFVKIKNLQSADFTIDEIKALLTVSDEQVIKAFDQKIAEQQEKLKRIREIQQSYLVEKNNMEKLISEMSSFIAGHLDDYAILSEFGLDPAEGDAVAAKVKLFFEESMRRNYKAEENVRLRVDENTYEGADDVLGAIRQLSDAELPNSILFGDEETIEESAPSPDEYDVLMERHGWTHVYEFIEKVPCPEKGKEYSFEFLINNALFGEADRKKGLSFALCFLGIMRLRNDCESITMGCSVNVSDDGKNHFRILCKKTK